MPCTFLMANVLASERVGPYLFAMSTRALALFAAAALSCNAAFADEVFCNQADDDRLIRLLPTEIEFWEEACSLPKEVSYSGAPMTLECGWGDTDETWTRVVSLVRTGDVIHYQEADRSEELRPCP